MVTSYSLSDTVDLLPHPYYFLIAGAIIFILLKIVKIFSSPEPPSIHYCLSCENSTIKATLEDCPSLQKIYKPPTLWGRNGHIQTATYGLLGHTSLKRSADKRHYMRFKDGATATFDVFEPIKEHPGGGDFTLALCPGIANSSESNYIRTCVHYAQELGFRCGVLNHLGVLKDVPLTSSRIFTYGGTQEYEAMVMKLLDLYPQTSLVLVGFSMGGNIVTKYLGLCGHNVNSRIISGISVCQGYDAVKSMPVMHEWQDLRRIYLYIMTENMKHLLRRNREKVLLPHVKSGLVDDQQIWPATSLLSFDEHFSRKVNGFDTVNDYYRWCSSIHVIENIRVPMAFINSLDDPLVPKVLWSPVKKIAERMSDTVFVMTKHGGHLGFLEGHSYTPKSITWIDRVIVELANSMLKHYISHEPCHSRAV